MSKCKKCGSKISEFHWCFKCGDYVDAMDSKVKKLIKKIRKISGSGRPLQKAGLY